MLESLGDGTLGLIYCAAPRRLTLSSTCVREEGEEGEVRVFWSGKWRLWSY